MLEILQGKWEIIVLMGNKARLLLRFLHAIEEERARAPNGFIVHARLHGTKCFKPTEEPFKNCMCGSDHASLKTPSWP